MAYIRNVTLVVADYDEAIEFYTRRLGFTLVEDTPLGGEKRWVRVAPPGANETCLLLARAVTEGQRAAIGHQAGGRVGFFLETDDFARDYARYRGAGVRFVRDPVEEPYGVVAVFADLCGNQWDLIQSK